MAKLREAIDVFLGGSWTARATRFTIVVQASLRSIAEQEEIELQAARFAACGICFAALVGEDLTDRLRTMLRVGFNYSLPGSYHGFAFFCLDSSGILWLS
ncbi:hypothetical protein [Caballeronia sordidicola]|uniref:hypothetical protein n=1 Tax=Caballeronia sordidicola TaxID=196367 RepID=UPI000B798C9F|nr:hypothetical protein [Caballeronia sordidicola]